MSSEDSDNDSPAIFSPSSDSEQMYVRLLYVYYGVK